MSQFTSRFIVRRGVEKAVAAFFAAATLITVSTAPVSAKPAARAVRGERNVRFLPVVDPFFGLPVSLQNLTWGNYKDTDTTEDGSMTQSNLTWGNFTSEETATASGSDQ